MVKGRASDPQGFITYRNPCGVFGSRELSKRFLSGALQFGRLILACPVENEPGEARVVAARSLSAEFLVNVRCSPKKLIGSQNLTQERREGGRGTCGEGEGAQCGGRRIREGNRG